MTFLMLHYLYVYLVCNFQGAHEFEYGFTFVQQVRIMYIFSEISLKLRFAYTVLYYSFYSVNMYMGYSNAYSMSF